MSHQPYQPSNKAVEIVRRCNVVTTTKKLTCGACVIFVVIARTNFSHLSQTIRDSILIRDWETMHSIVHKE
jgi:hypothetical protein